MKNMESIFRKPGRKALIAYVTVGYPDVQATLRAVGRITYDETQLSDISLKVDGWIDELMVDYVGQRVEKGQPLFRIYSPELVTAQDEYLIQQQTSQPGRGGGG